MPIRRVKGGYKWGGHGHVYPTRAGAEKQAAAAHANGFHGDAASTIAAASDDFSAFVAHMSDDVYDGRNRTG